MCRSGVDDSARCAWAWRAPVVRVRHTAQAEQTEAAGHRQANVRRECPKTVGASADVEVQHQHLACKVGGVQARAIPIDACNKHVCWRDGTKGTFAWKLASHRSDGDFGKPVAQCRANRFDFRAANIASTHQSHTVEIASFEYVVVNERQTPNTLGTQRIGEDGPRATATHNGHVQPLPRGEAAGHKHSCRSREVYRGWWRRSISRNVKLATKKGGHHCRRRGSSMAEPTGRPQCPVFEHQHFEVSSA